MVVRRNIKEAFSKIGSLSRQGTQPAAEPVYQQIFQRDIERLGIIDDFYPVGFAANYGILYFLTRALIKFNFNHILEIGGGQTSFLLDRLKKARITDASIYTMEHDVIWAGIVAKQVAHEVTVVDLVETAGPSGRFRGIDFSRTQMPNDIDLLIIDGPPGSKLGGDFARHGALSLCERLNPKGFIIVIDDVERFGEAALAKHIEDRLSALNREYKRGNIVAAKNQAIICGGILMEAAFF